MYNPDDESLGHFGKLDGNIEFYGRIKAVAQKDFVVADVGAGRGEWYHDDKSAYRRSVRYLKGHVARLIGCDVDPAVLENTSCDETGLIVNGRLPLDDASVDLVYADWVLEHITDPQEFYAEIDRVLKPGGYFCARTPHALNYVTVVSRLVKNTLHGRVLGVIQPGRKDIDVFPTVYRLNTRGALNRYWTPEKWENFSYVYVAEPRYFGGSRALFGLFSVAHRFLPERIAGTLMLFYRKKR